MVVLKWGESKKSLALIIIGIFCLYAVYSQQVDTETFLAMDTEKRITYYMSYSGGEASLTVRV